jgi:uncharacterized protein YukE
MEASVLFRRVCAGVLGIALCALFISCAGETSEEESSAEQTTAEEVKKEVAEAAEAIKDYSLDKREEAVKQAEMMLEELDERISKLETEFKAQSEEFSQTAQKEMQMKLEELRQQRRAVSVRYEALKGGSEEAWEETKEGFSDAYDAIRASLKKAGKEMQSK